MMQTATAKSAVVVAPGLGVQQRIEAQRDAARFREYTLLGRISVIVFDPRGMNAPERGYDVINGNMLDWEALGPWLGVSNDHQDLIICGPAPHPPDLRDTRTYPPALCPQRYSDRTQSKFGDFLVIQPVVQVLYKPKGLAEWKLIRVSAGFDDTQMAFLIDPATREAHLVGGRFEL